MATTAEAINYRNFLDTTIQNHLHQTASQALESASYPLADDSTPLSLVQAALLLRQASLNPMGLRATFMGVIDPNSSPRFFTYSDGTTTWFHPQPDTEFIVKHVGYQSFYTPSGSKKISIPFVNATQVGCDPKNLITILAEKPNTYSQFTNLILPNIFYPPYRKNLRRH